MEPLIAAPEGTGSSGVVGAEEGKDAAGKGAHEKTLAPGGAEAVVAMLMGMVGVAVEERIWAAGLMAAVDGAAKMMVLAVADAERAAGGAAATRELPEERG